MQKNKKILVGGGAGYIGTQLVPLLVEAGYRVEVIDLLWFGNHLPEGVKVIKKDLFDLLFAGVQAGCHDARSRIAAPAVAP